METNIYETPRCFHCGQTGFLELPITQAMAYANGALAQVAFPDLDRELREQIISGTHPKCWQKMFFPFSNEDEEE